jgi:titin
MTAPTFDILNGREHTVVVHAVNEAGQSEASNSSAATPVSVPGPVVSLAAAPILNGTRVDFDTPTDNGGSPVLDYEVEVVTVAGSTRAAIQTVPQPVPADGVDITAGLSAGTEYVVKVRARNVNGFGPVETSSVVVPGRPTAPRNVTVASGDTSLAVTWTAPQHDGGVAIASYVATAYAVGTTNVVGTPAVVTSGLSGTITGLVNGTTYDVRVVASHDASGAILRGLESDTEKGIPGRPTPPTNVTATATASQTLTITWSRVDNVPGITVAGYRVRLVGGTTTEVNYTGCSTSTCTYNATGLTNGTEYTVSVAGYVSGPAYGLVSDTAIATAMGPAGAPTVEAEAASQSAVVSITAPASTGGTPITGYTVSVSPTPADAYESSLAADPSPFTITGLTNGTTYTVTVRTVNEMGQSSAGTTTVVPSAPPSSPQNVRARPGSIVVTWDPPSSTGGAAVSHYLISVTDSDGIMTQFSTATSNPTGTSSCTTAGRSCTVNSVFTSESPETLVSIPDDMEYRVDVTAVNAQGSGDPSSAYVLISGQPDMPTNVEARGGVASIEMCWTPPSGTLTAYQIDLGRSSYSGTVTVEVASLAAPSWCASPKVGHVFAADDDGVDVVVGSVHALSAKATVSSGDYVFGVSSAEVEATPYDVPGAPSITTVSTTASTATVTWGAAAPRGSEVTGYVVTATPTGETCTWSPGPLTCTFSGLVGNDTYVFSVEAVNAAGTGPASATVSATIDATKPSPVWGAPEMGSNRRLAYTATFDETIYYTVTFDEAVTGFALADGDVSNSGTAPGCVFALAARSTRVYDLTALCGGAGTLVLRISADSVVDAASNTGPLLDVDAAQVTLYDPSTTSTVAPTTVAPTSTTSPESSSGPSPTTTTTIDEDERASASRATTTTNPSTGVAQTTVPATSEPPRIADDPTQQLPPEIDSRLPDDEIATPDRPSPGQDVTLDKCGFDPGETVRVYVGSSIVDRATADSRGCVSVEITIDNSSSGRLGVALYGTTSKTGAKTTLFVAGRLTATGWSQQRWIVLGLIALLLGATVASMSRRRRPI